MSVTFPLKYENYLGYAGQTVSVKDSDGNVLGTGTIDTTGFGIIPVTVDENFGGTCYLVQDSGSVRIGVDTPDRAMILSLQTAVDAIAIPGGSGAFEVTVHTGVALASVRMVQTDGIQNEPNTADGSGDVVFRLDTGHFDIYASAPGYSSYSSPTPVHVQADGDEFTVSLTQNVITPPADPELCKLYGYFKHPDQSPWAGLKIKLTLQAPSPSSNGYVIAGRTVELMTDANGELGTNDDNTTLVDRNDAITPAGTAWQVEITQAKVFEVITLDDVLFDLGSLVEA